MTPREKEFRRLMRERPQDGAVAREYVQYLLDADRPNHARRALREGLERISDDPELHLMNADVLMVDKKFEASAEALRLAKEAGLPPEEVRGFEGRLAAAQGDMDKGIAVMREAVELKPQKALLKKELAELLLVARSYDEALHLYAQLSEAEPETFELELGAGMALLHLGRFEEAEVRFATATRLDPTRGDAANGFARTLDCLGRAEEGMSVLERFLEAHPRDSDIMLSLIEVYYGGGYLKDALELAHRLIRVEGESSGAHMLLANLYTRHGQPEEAGRHARRAMSDPVFELEARGVLASHALHAKRLDEMERILEPALDRWQSFPSLRLLHAQLMFERNHLDEAEEDLDALIAFDPSRAQPLALKGSVCWQRRDGAAAEIWVKRALAIDPDCQPARMVMGSILLSRGEIEQGRGMLKGLIDAEFRRDEERSPFDPVESE